MKTFKPSGVDWLGDIPAHWQVCPLKYLCAIFSGTTPDSDETSYWDGDIVWITPADFKTEDKFVREGHKSLTKAGFNSCSLRLIPPRSLIFSKRAPIGAVSINEVALTINQGCLACVPFDNCDVNFYFYVLATATQQFEHLGAGTTFKEISLKNFRQVKVPCPPLDEQEKIAAYLDKTCGALDREIEIQRALIDKLRVYKKSLIYEVVTGGLNPDVPKKFSGVEWLGDIPAHWSTSKLKFVARNNVETLSEKTAVNTAIRYIDIGSVDYSDGVKKVQEFIFEDAPTRARRVLHEDDTIISTVRTYLKAIAYIEKIFDGHIGSTGFAVLTPRENVFGKFLYYAVSSAPFIAAVEANSFGVSYPAVNDSILKNLKVPLPPLDEQKTIAAYLDRKCRLLDENISERTALVGRLSAYKKSLIYEVVTGKTEVGR